MVLSHWVKAQVPVADFSGSPSSGCAALVVSFKDESTGDPKFWNWDFGNGQLANIQNPVVVYSQPGVYTVTLVVKNGNGTHGITKTNYITVNPSPQANFSSSITTGCAPVDIQFTDISTDQAGNITRWEWDFGDNTKSSSQNPVKRYAVTGFYSVTLTVTSSTGCKSTASRNRYIRIVSGVKANFNNTVNGNCNPPFTANFINQSSGPGALAYTWDFGNGSTSTLQNPSSPYNAPGTYLVSLTTTSDFGCSNSIQKTVQIRSSNTVIGGPDSICVNKPLNFTNTSVPAPSSAIWYFDDGTQSTAISPSKTFSVPGPHIVKLVNTYPYCKDSITKTIEVVTPPVIDFTSTSALGCKAPLTVTFTDASPTTGVAWLWNFGDGSTSNQQNPSHTYNSAGQFNVSLTVTNSFGCTNTLVKNAFVKIIKPTLNISNVPGEGCAPFTFQPIPVVTSVDAISSYLWDFGDGPGSTRPGANPSYTYNNPGTYTITLTITTTGGCTETKAFPNAIKTGTPPVVDFTADKITGCAKDSIRFTSTATPFADKWFWNFGDGDTSNLQNPTHTFQDTGKLSVTLIAYNNGCASVPRIRTDYITITPLVARFDYQSVSCNDRLNIQFTNTSIIDLLSPETYQWDFGDGITTTSKNPTHKYADSGIYNVTLIVRDAINCPDTIIKKVAVIYQRAIFKASKIAPCKNERITIFTTADTNKISKYEWRINGGSRFLAPWSFDTSFIVNGPNEVQLILTDTSGCTDTNTVAGFITVAGPIADFTTPAPGACQSKSVTFTDQSTSARTIAKWTWDFGDSTVQTYTAPPFNHTYRDTGAFSVKLIVQDVSGCTDTVIKTNIIIITKPLVDFGASDTIYCQGKDLQFNNLSQGYNLNYLWNFGDGSNSTLQDPTHAYTGSDANYSVQLKITDIFGCSDSLTKTNFIDIRYPKSAFTAEDTLSICPPLQATFFNKGRDYESLYWDFGDGTGGPGFIGDTVSHYYNSYGSFTVKQYVVGYGGCFDSSSHAVNIYNPASATLTYNPLDACNSLNVDFAITTPPQTRFTFFYGDGRLDSSQVKTFSHFFNSPNFYNPSLLLYDDLGCIASVSGAQVIKVLGAIPNFARDRKEFCDTGIVYFTNYTLANDPITSSVWDFDDGTTSTDQDPIHYFNRPDQYAVSLNVTTQAGCKSSIIDTIRVYRTPDVSINSIDIACINSPVLFNSNLAFADTAITWKWDLGNGRSSSSQDITSVYSQTGNYTITLEAANRLGCKDTTSKTISVAPLPVITMGPDPVIPVGTGINLPVTYSNTMRIYNWTPTNNLNCADCAFPFANPKFTTRYKVAVTDSNGCKATSDVTVRVVCNNKNYFVPNTFTPNGDGVNDVFYPRGASIDRIQSMRVFNRWGQIVFEKKNFTVNSIMEGWNGTFQGKPANADTYVYIIEYLCENAEIVTYKGNVTLLR